VYFELRRPSEYQGSIGLALKVFSVRGQHIEVASLIFDWNVVKALTDKSLVTLSHLAVFR
jgi:hypothetical protein